MSMILLVVCNLAAAVIWVRYIVNAMRTGKLRTRGVDVYRDRTPRAFAVLIFLASVAAIVFCGMLVLATTMAID